MSATMNVRVPRKEYVRWLAYLRTQGFQVQEEHRGSMMDNIQVSVHNPDGTMNPLFAAMSFMDAETGRRVYAVQIRAVTPDDQPALQAAANRTPHPLHA